MASERRNLSRRVKESHGKGVLVSDRTFDDLMRDETVIKAMTNSDALLVTDAFQFASRLGNDFLRRKSESGGGSSSSANRRSVFESGSKVSGGDPEGGAGFA